MKQVTEAIARMIVLDLQPYSIVEDVGFRHLLNIAEPRYEIANRSIFARNIIPRMYKNVSSELRKKMKKDIAQSN